MFELKEGSGKKGKKHIVGFQRALKWKKWKRKNSQGDPTDIKILDGSKGRRMSGGVEKNQTLRKPTREQDAPMSSDEVREGRRR